MIPSGVTREAALAELDILIARESLGDFSTLVSPSTYEQPPHVLLLIEYLEALERGDIQRLIVEFPPRTSKTTHISRLFPSWWLGRHPSDGVILGSYSDTLATDNGRAVRDLAGHRQYPFTARIRPDVKSAGRWQTTAGGGLIAVGVGTGLTGWPFPGSLAVVDDPVKGRLEAESEIERENTWVWWQETLMTRLAESAAVVLGGTRWHEDDLIGRVKASAGASDWTILTLPYYAEAGDALGRPVDEPLRVFGTVPSVAKGEISAYGFSALYQQRPTPAGGGTFTRAGMQRRFCVCGGMCGAPLLTGERSRWRVIQTVDLGGKQGVGHDPSAIATWATDGISYFVLDYWSSQAEYAEVKPKFISKFFEFRPRMMFVEDATWAQPLISDLRRASGVLVQAIPAVGSKWTRADDVSEQFASGKVVLPCRASWLDAWVHEHLAFPNGAHDEAVDTTSMALKILVEHVMGQMPEPQKPKVDALRRQFLGKQKAGAPAGALGGLRG